MALDKMLGNETAFYIPLHDQDFHSKTSDGGQDTEELRTHIATTSF